MGSNPAIPTKGTGVRAIAVLGAETAVGAEVMVGLRDHGFTVHPVDDAGPVPAAVTAVIDAGALREPAVTADLVALSADDWVATAEAPLRRALHVLQLVHRSLRGTGGRVVVLLPSLVMSGAAGVTGWAAAAEGYRALTKAAARAWGTDGISLQCVLVPTRVDRPGLQAPALTHTPELAPILAALLDERLDALTGLTLAADGGVWMTS